MAYGYSPGAQSSISNGAKIPVAPTAGVLDEDRDRDRETETVRSPPRATRTSHATSPHPHASRVHCLSTAAAPLERSCSGGPSRPRTAPPRGDVYSVQLSPGQAFYGAAGPGPMPVQYHPPGLGLLLRPTVPSAATGTPATAITTAQPLAFVLAPGRGGDFRLRVAYALRPPPSHSIARATQPPYPLIRVTLLRATPSSFSQLISSYIDTRIIPYLPKISDTSRVYT
ncbi:hypothetical protein B0H19DRAFT_1245698 [Mycena capillaripes]|nr:hypothetical protein B0H19DRAFT_1245698 [Mycena capillaripes]